MTVPSALLQSFWVWLRQRCQARQTLACAVSVIGAVIVIAVLRDLVMPWMGVHAIYMPFLILIAGAGLWCGLWTAIVATCVSLALGTYLSSEQGPVLAQVVSALAFLVTASVIVLLSASKDQMYRAAAESNLRAAEQADEAATLAEELNLMIDGAHEQAFYMIDTDGHVAAWNKGAAHLYGWAETEIVGQPLSLLYPPDLSAYGKPANDLIRAQTAGPFEEEEWCLRNDGSEFIASVFLTALFDRSDGSLRGFARVVSDITKQRVAEAASRWRESQLSSILSTVPDALIVIDDSGAILSFNPVAEAMFGYAERDVMGRNVNILMPESKRLQHDRCIGRYLETRQRRIIGASRVVQAQRKDNTLFPVELFIGEANNGDQTIFTGFIRDLTDRRRTEEQVETLQAELLHVARVGAMGAMASTLAHELNQPIAAIANYVEAVRDQLQQPDPGNLPLIREALEDAGNEALRAGRIVRRLREFVARGEVERTVEPLPNLISEAAVLGLMGTREQHIEAIFDLEPGTSLVLVDRVQIQQVLINLIRNACEAMTGPTRQLTIASRSEGATHVRVTVSDTGTGIAESVRDQLFDAFVSTKHDGMGVGLSICRTIVEANGGRIWAEPRLGGGTHFHFTLMRALTED